MGNLVRFTHSELGVFERMQAPSGDHRYVRHAHDEFSVILVTAGHKIFRVGRSEQIVEPGQIVVVAPGDSHECEPIKGTKWAHRCWYLTPKFVASITGNLHGESSPRISSRVLDDPALAHRLMALHHEGTQDGSCILNEANALQAVLMAEPHNKLPMFNASAASSRRWRIYRDVLSGSEDEDVDTDMLAKSAGISKYQVFRDMSQIAQMSPRNFIKDVRLRKSKELLRAGVSVSEVSAMLSFADQSHFTRSFKSSYGVTPKKYAVAEDG